MLRIKVPVANLKLEAEGDTEQELEAALRVALRVAASLTDAPASEAAEQPPSRLRSMIDRAKSRRDDVSRPPGYRPPSYDGLDKNRDRLRVAACDLVLNFGKQAVTAKELLQHLDATGGSFQSKAKDPSASARQALRMDPLMESTELGWRPSSRAMTVCASRLFRGENYHAILSEYGDEEKQPSEEYAPDPSFESQAAGEPVT